MQSATNPVLPSPNSAFVRPTRSRRGGIEPSAPVCKRLVFDESLQNGKDAGITLCDVINTNQTNFASRWRCHCDVISSCCSGHTKLDNKTFNIPKYDWVPICKSEEETPSLLKRFELVPITFNTERRPESPIPPFLSQRFCDSPLSPVLSDETNTKSIEDASSLLTKQIEEWLTPPVSPCLRIEADTPLPQVRRKQRQTKHAEAVQLKKSHKSSCKNHETAAQVIPDQENRVSLKRKDMSP